MAHNVLQLGEVAGLKALNFNLALMFIRNPNVQFSTEPAILPNCCKPFGVLFVRWFVGRFGSVTVKRWLFHFMIHLLSFQVYNYLVLTVQQLIKA